MMTKTRISVYVGLIAIPKDQHDLPKHSERWLPKYNPDDPITAKEHVKQFMLSLKLEAVQHEYEVCKLFPFTFMGKDTTWYFTVADGSITTWESFDKLFIKMYGEDKTKASLIVELSNIRIN